MRERLIETLTKTFDEQYEKRCLITPQHTADYLIADGWIRPPCKVGDVVWVYNQRTNEIYKNTVVCIKISGTGLCKNTISVEYRNVRNETSHRKFTWSQIGKQVFFAREEAEAKLKEGGKG